MSRTSGRSASLTPTFEGMTAEKHAVHQTAAAMQLIICIQYTCDTVVKQLA